MSLKTFWGRYRTRLNLVKLQSQLGLLREPLEAVYERWEDEVQGRPLHTVHLMQDQAGGGKQTWSGLSFASPVVASTKAFFEKLEGMARNERADPRENTRNGWAVRKSKEEAWEHATAELLERDAFLMHLLCPELKTTVLKAPELIRERRFHFAKLQCLDAKRAVVLGGIQLREKEPYFLSLGIDPTVTGALWKAYLEGVMLKRAYEARPLEDKEQVDPLIWHHYQAGLNPSVRETLEQIFDGGGSTLLCDGLDRKNFFDARRFEQSWERSFEDRVYALRVCHPELIELQFGELWENSRGEVEQKLKARGLKPGHWVTHPFL